MAELLNVAHHITQPGNARRFILENDQERRIYLDLLQQGIQRHGVALIGYCLMSNHIHLVAVPRNKDALARSLKQTHGRFASYWNAVNHSSGHVWQGRYYSCPLDETHLWEALRYTELNPVRASLVAYPRIGLGHLRLPIAALNPQVRGWTGSFGGSDGPPETGAPICKIPRMSQAKKPSATAPTAGGHLAPRSSLARWKSKRTAH
jgi:REP element-mobilizing transposase RayT